MLVVFCKMPPKNKRQQAKAVDAGFPVHLVSLLIAFAAAVAVTVVLVQMGGPRERTRQGAIVRSQFLSWLGYSDSDTGALPWLAATQGERGPIGVVDWHELEAMGKEPGVEIARRQEPVRVLMSPASKFAALQWTGELIAERLGLDYTIPGVITSAQPTVVYYDSKRPLTSLPGFEPSKILPQHAKRSVVLGEFLRSVENSNDDVYMYWVAKKHAGNMPLWMEKDLAGSHVFSATGGVVPKMQLWFGEHGLTSSFHYDAAHNYYVQLAGTKTFAILPPRDAPALSICPFLHPGDGHSCLNWSTTNVTSLKPHLANLQPYIVDLGPGDVLYIPP